MHQVLTGNQVIDLRFVLRQVIAELRAVGMMAWCASTFLSSNSGCVYLDLPLAAATDLVHDADGIHHRVASGKMFFWQIAQSERG